LNQLNGIFVARQHEREFDRITSRFTGHQHDFKDLVYEKKKLILYSSLVSEVNVLARQLSRIAEANRWSRDFTLYSLRAALIEIVANFPVYRTYLDGTSPDERDREYVEQAVRRAKRKNPTVSASIFDFIADILLQRFSEHISEEERQQQLQFAIKLQQVLGPVMAKGLEDTTLYVYNRLASLNEVGGEPSKFGNTLDEFHAANKERQKLYSRSLLATATHDTKRGEDIRARIDALSEMPKDWAGALLAFNKVNARFKTDVDGREAPDRNEEMLLYQTLMGGWPWRTPNGAPELLSLPAAEDLKSLRERLQAYFLKATKEAKVNTSWIQPDERWDEAVAKFVAGVVEQPSGSRFWRIFLPLARRVAHVGLHNSLSQVLLKIASPGVPDIYQGNELWDFALVDPDNRRPVDYELRARMLKQLDADRGARGAVAAARERYLKWEDGAVKLLVTALGLRARKSHAELFGDGEYLPLRAAGTHADRLAAFARRHGDELAVAVAPRLVNDLLTGDDRSRALPARVFSGAMLPVPGLQPGDKLVDVFTEESHVARRHEGGAALEIDALLGVLPVSLLLKAP
jgi:(1->4)-alpha-D-glucan 1-alpha-D-glucosylmutase